MRSGTTASHGFPCAHVLVLMASSALPPDAASAVDAVDMRALAARLRDCAHDIAVLVNVCNDIAAGVTAHPARSLEARAAGVLPLVLDALNMHAQHELLATSACWALSTLCGVGSSSDAPTLDTSVAAAVTRAATVALAAHGAQSARCATTAALMIGNWSMTMRQQYNDTGATTAACDAGAVPALALAMQAHAEDADVQQWCARALVALMVALGSAGDTAHVRAHAADYARARDAAVAALQRHAATSRDVANEACGLICNIAERLPEQRAAPAAQAVSAVLAAMQAHDVVVRGQATLALETLIHTRSELGDHASDAAGRAAAEGGAFGALAAGLEQAQAAGCEGRSRFGMLFMASCSALACVAPYAHGCAAASQPGQAARATEAVCAALHWSLAESNLRRNAHALGQDKLQAMQLASTVYAAMNLGINAPARADILRATGVVALLPALAVRLAQLTQAYPAVEELRTATLCQRSLKDELLGSCGACGAVAGPAAALKKCAACRAVAYCCTGCQRRGWTELGHRGVCAAAAAARAAAAAAASAEQ